MITDKIIVYYSLLKSILRVSTRREPPLTCVDTQVGEKIWNGPSKEIYTKHQNILPQTKQTNEQRILVNFSISKNSMALGTRPLERVPNNVS